MDVETKTPPGNEARGRLMNRKIHARSAASDIIPRKEAEDQGGVLMRPAFRLDRG